MALPGQLTGSQSSGGDAGGGGFSVVNNPNATTPPISAPMAPAAPAPTPSPYVPQQTGTTPTPQSTPPGTNTQPAPTQNTQNTQGAAPLTMPANGSVVDLLNSTGQDSSQASRQALASQFGVKGYDFSAAKNTELAQKYLDYFNSKQGTPAPNTNPRQDIQDSTQTPVDPQQNFFDQVGSMNPVVSSLYNQVNQALSAPATTQTFSDQYQQLVQAQGIPALQTQLMNVQNIMKGTEDDIRTEIQKAGGFATESQVQALTSARNKTLLTQANSLSQQLQQKDDYVNQVMQFSQADRANVEKQVNDKLGLADKLTTLTTDMNKAAQNNYQKIVDTVGYSGLAGLVAGNPGQQAAIEKSLSLPKGALSNQDFLKKSDTATPGKVYGSATTGYFTYNPTTGAAQPIQGAPSKSTSATPKPVSAAQTSMNEKNDVAAAVQDFQAQMKTKNWAGANPDAYNYYKTQLTKLYGAAAATALDKAMKTAGVTVDYANK